MTCRIDHTLDGSIPVDLCRCCHPELNEQGELVSHAAREAAEYRDFRIPKGMSTEEGRAMLARRQMSEKAKQQEALFNLLQKHEGEFYDHKLKAWLPLAARGAPCLTS